MTTSTAQDIVTKICSQCKQEKPLDDEFHVDVTKKDGHHTICKDCRNESNRLYSARPEIKEHKRLYSARPEVKEHKKEYNKEYRQTLSGRYSNVRSKAINERNFEFSLTIEQFDQITKLPCTYCGEYWKEDVNGVDRIDSDGGYVEGNVTPACFTCNSMKNSLSVEEFYDHINRIKDHMTSERGKLLESYNHLDKVISFEE